MITFTPPWPSASGASYRLTAHEIHIWQASLDASPEEQERLYRLLDPDEQDRARAFRLPRLQRQYIVAHGILRLLLARYLKNDPEKLTFSYNQYGKPALIPENNPEHLQFNLSHSGERVLYAMALHRQLGIDIEWIHRRVGEMEQIAARYFSHYENHSLLALPESQKATGFFNCWTRKEAYIKARGRGLSLPLHTFDVTLRPGEPAQVLATRDDPAQASRWVMQALTPDQDYIAALVAEGGAWKLECRQWS